MYLTDMTSNPIDISVYISAYWYYCRPGTYQLNKNSLGAKINQLESRILLFFSRPKLISTKVVTAAL
jgi:hypothetical protein